MFPIITLYANSEKTEFFCFIQNGAISSLKSKPMKLVNQFIYLGNNISSTEGDFTMCIGKAWSIDRLLTLWKFDLSDKIKWEFFQAVCNCVSTIEWLHHLDFKKKPGEKKLDGNYSRILHNVLNKS